MRGTLGDVDLGAPRGEYVLVVDGRPARRCAARRRRDPRPRCGPSWRPARSRRDAAAAVAAPARRAAPCGLRPRGDRAGGRGRGLPWRTVTPERRRTTARPRQRREAGRCDERRTSRVDEQRRHRQRVPPDDRLRPERGVLRPRPHADLRLVGVHPGHDGALGRPRADPPVRPRRRRGAGVQAARLERPHDRRRARPHPRRRHGACARTT